MASGSKEPIIPIFWHIAQTGLIERWVVRRSRWSMIYQRTFGEAWVKAITETRQFLANAGVINPTVFSLSVTGYSPRHNHYVFYYKSIYT